jgi:hypothetical protein
MKQKGEAIMTYRQTQWAAKHDWHISTIGTDTQGYRIVVRNDEPNKADLVFHNFTKLYSWAGY